tara:strand:- start:49 stop:255 length:207 start_codon:yes stop_codon:yes gene_type:complete
MVKTKIPSKQKTSNMLVDEYKRLNIAIKLRAVQFKDGDNSDFPVSADTVATEWAFCIPQTKEMFFVPL